MCRSLLMMADGSLYRQLIPSMNRLLLACALLLFTQAAHAQFTVTFDVTEPTCYGQPNGSITAIVSGGMPPFTYLWNTGETGPTLNGITAGTYTVTVTDATNFQVIKNETVTQPNVVSVDLVANTCAIPIVITATGSGGQPPYNYNWSTGQTGSVISVPTAGTYCVTMTDQSLCGAVECIMVTLNPLNVSVTANDLTCDGLDDGQVVANPVGGTPPYSYQWNNGATTASQTGLPAGVYTVTVTDAAGCMDSASGVVQSPPPLTVNAIGVNPDCLGDNNGQASAIASGGTPPLSYQWSNGATTPVISNIGQGTYSVTVTDINNCSAVDQVTLAPSSNLSVIANPGGESCPDENDGSVTATPLNGVAPYSYFWSNGGITQTISNLTPGTYSVTVLDAVGCTATASAVVTSASPFGITISSNNVTICNGNNGSATVNVIIGTGPFTYQWSDGQTTQTASNLTGGTTYNVTVTDGNGCEETSSVFITTPPDVMVTIVADDVVCPGEATGTAMAVASAGTPPYSYLWNTGATTMDLINLPAGTYTVTVTDAALCTDVASVTITESPAISVTINGTEIVCGAEETGQASAVVSGGTPPYTYQWSTGSNTPTIFDLPEGIYGVTVTDALGCSAVADFDVDIIDDFELDIAIQNVLCFGETSASILAEGWGGTPPYTYQWNTGLTGTPLLENIGTGFYSVTVTDQNGCVLIESFTITEPPLLTASATATDELCPGETTGMAMAVGMGGTTPYTYLWNTGATTQAISGLGAGTYTVTITDKNNCEAVASVTIDESPGVTVVITGTDIVCGAGNTGSATANTSSGTPPFIYQWSNGQTTQTINGLVEGTYSVTVTDANGCQGTDSFTIDVIDDFEITGTVTNVLCFEDSNGAITVTPTGGTPPYTYAWDNGETTATITNLAAGSYTVTVTDQNNCTVIETFFVSKPPLLQVGVTGTPSVCPGESTGMAMAVATGGTMPYSYLWNNGQTTQSITNLAAGTYTVTVTDDNGCTDEASITIVESPDLDLTINGTEIVCGDGNTGSAAVSATGGVPPYTYEWNNGETAESIDDLPEGIYIVTVTDANGCTAVEQVTIDVIDDFSIMVTPFDVLCEGGNTGRILVIPSGGTAPYTYLWSNGETTNEIIDLSAGVYSVTVTDDNGCEVSQTITINEPTAINITLTGNDINCFDFDNGSISSSVMGGTPPYTYAWSNGESTPNIANLAPGTYTLTVTDANLCTATESIVITQPDALQVAITGQDLFCFGDASGSATALVNGGTMPYNYLWSNGQTTSSISGLQAGTYGLTITDDNGCIATSSVTIDQPDDLTVTINEMDIFCVDANDGSLTAVPSGGTPPYSYEWSNGESTMTIGNLPAGTYTVTVTDVNECEVVGTATIDEFPGLMLIPIASSPDCFGETTGAATVLINGGTGPFTYLWSNGSTDPELLNIPAGTYTVTVTDAVGCTGVETIGVAQPELLIAQVTSTNTTDVSCNSFADGEATVSVDGGTPPYTYLWSDGQTTATATGLAAGNYSATVTDANGCEAMVDVTIEEPPVLDLSASTIVGGTCDGSSDGSAQATASGGTPPYTYAWSNGASTATISNLVAGVYTVTLTDANNCTATATVTIVSFPTPTCSINILQEVTMGDNGELGASVNGGTAPFNYLWSNGATTPAISNLTAGTYSLTVTDANGCETTCSVTLEALAGIGDYVWEDIDQDGVQDPNEPPVEGVEVKLKDENGDVIATTTTDVNGNYLFLGLDPGIYSVMFVLPNGYEYTILNAGGDDTIDSDADPAMNGMTETTTLVAGEIDTTWDAGIYLPPSIIEEDCICLDNSTTDDNGQFQETVTINSYPNEIWTIVTPVGIYDFASPAPPAAPVAIPNGTTITEIAPGVYEVDYLVVDDMPASFTVTNGITDFNVNTLCEYPSINLVALPPEICIFDDPFLPDATPSLPGTLVFSVDGVPVNSIDPQALGVGTYVLTVEFIPDDPTECTASIVTTFIIIDDCLSIIGDYVWEDEDRDGIQDPNEDGIPGVMVILQIPGEASPTNIDTTFTDINGFYFFDVLPGDYKVLFVQPDGYIFTDQDQGTNDALDSDVDPDMGMTGVYTIGANETNLTIDAGLYTKCDNITNPGLIGPAMQFLCGPGNDPDPILNVQTPTGGSGAIEYLWMYSTEPGPFNTQTWSPIPGATGDSYDPGPLSETTYFTRCVRRECCDVYLESNIVTIEVGSVAVADVQGPDFVCVDEPTTFFAASAGPTAQIQWTFSPGVSPQTATGPQVAVLINNPGIFTITLVVTENGCTSTDIHTFTGTSSPLYCAGLLPIVVEVEDEVAGDVKLSWMMEEMLEDFTFEIQHSSNAVEFAAIGESTEPRAQLGGMHYYEFMHHGAKRGHNYYRLLVTAPNGDTFYSEIEDAILYNDSRIALLYPNPVNETAVLELFETFGEDVEVEIVNANGARVQYIEVDADTPSVNLDCADLPTGTYFVKVRYSQSGLKVLKLLKQ